MYLQTNTAAAIGTGDETDTVYVNSGSREQLMSREHLFLLESKSLGLNVDLADVGSGHKSNFNVATANNMNATWNQSMPI